LLRLFKSGAVGSTQHQHVDRQVPALCGTGGLARGRLEAVGVKFGDEENGAHYRTPASFLSFSTSSATLASLTPALRGGGSATLSVFRLGAVATANRPLLPIGFFFAIIGFGRFTKRLSLRRRSAEITAGRS